MNPDELKLRNMLADLCSAQDDVTHWNEKGPTYTQQAKAAQVQRNHALELVVNFVKLRVPKMRRR